MFDWIDTASDVLMNGVIVGMSMVGLVEEAPTHYALDSMLEGFTDGCQVSPQLEAFWYSAVQGEPLALPETADHYFGERQIRNDEEFREIRIPVAGMWMGHSVEYFALFAGNDNGISLVSVRFDPEDAGVATTFTPLADASGAKLDADPENYAQIKPLCPKAGSASIIAISQRDLCGGRTGPGHFSQRGMPGQT